MKRTRLVPVLLASLVLAVPVLRADVKTQQKSSFKFAGALGGVLNKFGGATTKEGLVTTSAIKGNRKLSISGDSGEIIDLGEEKLYNLDMKGKSYKVVTFAELRAAFEKAKADAEKKKQEMKPEEKQQMEDTAKQYEFDADVKETGQKKNIAGYDTREVILTITAHEKGKKVEESGGFIMATDMWLAPKVAALDELLQFQLKFIKAVYGEAFVADMTQMASTVAMYPTFKPMAEKMQAENGKLQGTPVLSTTTFDAVKSAEAMKEAKSQPPPTTGGGIGGMLAKKMIGPKGEVTQRGTVFTSSHEILSVSPTVAAEDVAMPTGFKEKK